MFLLLAFMFLPLLYLLGVTLTNALQAPMLKNASAPATTPKVSVLVPARNEEFTLRACLEDLCAQNYPDYEILVLDDNSIDDTWSIIEEFDRTNNPVRGFIGSELPRGWAGKAWACQQLAYEASGEILIFTDADNLYDPDAIRNTVAWMQNKELAFLSTMPQQFSKSSGDRMMGPTLDMLVYSALPMKQTLTLPQERLSAANGQWMAITREAYKQIGGHSGVKNELAEDVALVRKAKKQGLNTLITAGTGVVFGHSSGSIRESWENYQRTIFGITGGSRSGLLTLAGLLTGATVLPYLLLAWPNTRKRALHAVILNLLIRTVLSIKYRHPLELILFHPAAMTILIGVMISLLKTNHLHWKGRVIPLVRTIETRLT